MPLSDFPISTNAYHLTPFLRLPRLFEGERGSVEAFNRALKILDLLIPYPRIEDAITAPPGSPVDPGVYFVRNAGTGDFINRDYNLAIRLDGVWYFTGPWYGLMVFLKKDNGVNVNAMRTRTTMRSNTWVAP